MELLARYLITLGVNLLGNLLTGKRVLPASKITIRAG